MGAVPSSSDGFADFAVFQVLFIIANPEVYKSPNSDSYIVFGESKIEDAATSGFGNSVQQMQQQEEMEMQAAAARQSSVKTIDEDEGEADSEGLEEGDIEVVTSQVSTIHWIQECAFRD